MPQKNQFSHELHSFFEIVAFRNDYDAVLGDSESAFRIFFEIETYFRVGRNNDVLIDDDVPEFAVTPDLDVVQNDALVELAVAVDSDTG